MRRQSGARCRGDRPRGKGGCASNARRRHRLLDDDGRGRARRFWPDPEHDRRRRRASPDRAQQQPPHRGGPSGAAQQAGAGGDGRTTAARIVDGRGPRPHRAQCPGEPHPGIARVLGWRVPARRLHQHPFEFAVVHHLRPPRDISPARTRLVMAENSSRARRKRELAVPTGIASSSAICAPRSPQLEEDEHRAQIVRHPVEHVVQKLTGLPGDQLLLRRRAFVDHGRRLPDLDERHRGSLPPELAPRRPATPRRKGKGSRVRARCRTACARPPRRPLGWRRRDGRSARRAGGAAATSRRSASRTARAAREPPASRRSLGPAPRVCSRSSPVLRRVSSVGRRREGRRPTKSARTTNQRSGFRPRPLP